MPNLLVSNQDIASTPYKGFFSCILESRLHGTYIPILYDLNFLVDSAFVCFPIFWTLGGSHIGRLSMIPVIVKLCESPSKAGGLLMIKIL